jgi:4-amino-4-deoxy-L-arabinose transferase-like glycosyltransferase
LDTASIMAPRITRVVLCAGVAALLYFTGLGRPALWEPDEGRYAEVAREMLLQGDYVTPRNDWVRYFEKPPLVYWITVGAMRLFGANEFAARAPAALFSTGQVAVSEALGEAMFGPLAGVIGAVALALSPLFFAFARFATPDPALAFFFTAALASFYMAAESGSLRRRGGRNWMVLWMILAAALLGLGTLAKGPVALALGGAVALVWLVIEGRAREAFTIPWLRCAIVYLAITAPWFVLAAERNAGFLQFFFVHEHVQRYLESTEHEWGPYFFVIVVAGGMWPWLYFAPVGLHDLRSGDDNEPAVTKRRGALMFLLIWFGLVFIFFSIPRSKLGEYILPAFPPLAIIAGYGLSRLGEMNGGRVDHLMVRFVILNAAIGVAMALAAPTLIRHGMNRVLLQDGAVAGFGLLAGAVGATIASRFRRSTVAIALPVALGVLLAMGALMKAREDAAPMFSYRTLARAIGPVIGDGCALASYRHQIQSLPFYTRQREKLVGYRGELAPFGDGADARDSFIASDTDLEALWGSKACVVVVANRGDLPRLRRILTPAPSIIGCEGKKFALLNQRFAQPVASRPVQPSECDDATATIP